MEHVVEKLVIGGVATVERLGNMTPEQLEEMPGIDPEQVEEIRDAVVAYYAQYDQAGGEVAEPVLEEELSGEEAYLEPSAGVDEVQSEEEPPQPAEPVEGLADSVESVQPEEIEQAAQEDTEESARLEGAV
jgi:N utilization substance protein A